MRLNGKEISKWSLGSKPIQFLALGAKVIWEAVRSCFGSGKWIGNKPWVGKEKWKGTK